MVSPAVITIVPGVKPLNQTTPPGASGAPTVTPPTSTSRLVAAKLREEEKTKTTKIATDTTAAILANRTLCLRTGSTACGGIAPRYLTWSRSRPSIVPPTGPSGESDAVCVPRLGSQQGPNRVRAIRWSMKAARLFSYDKPLKIVDVDAPRIKNPSEVLVRVTGAGVCHTDLHIVEGVWREKVQVNLPYTLGHENAGVVQEVGDAVTSFKKGEKVIVHPVMTDGTCRPCRIGEDMHCENLVFPGISADGGFAEVLRTSERSLVRIHDLAPDDVAPLADAGLTAIRAVKKAASRTTSGSNVVVMGVGGLGHIALQLLRCMTNAVIIAADVAESKLRLAEKIGAHRVIDARRDPVKQVIDITGNRGADVVIDLVGNDLTLANGMKMLHKGGTLIIVGYGGTLSGKTIDVIFSQFSVLRSLVGNLDELPELMGLTRQGKIRVITQKGKLDEVNNTLHQLKKGTLEGRGVVIP